MREDRPVEKRDIRSLAEKNAIVRNIARALEERDGFLLLGHKSPDEDCLASMVAFGLIAAKFNKTVNIYACDVAHEQFAYLVNIATYNAIRVLCGSEIPEGPVGAVVVLDTPKPDMIDAGAAIRAIVDDPAVLRIEVDHHLGADASYFGDEGYALVAEASSACELVGYLALKLESDGELMRRRGIDELLSRNLVLAILTGIIADSQMGKYIKTRRERWFFERFSSVFDRMLAQKTKLGSHNFASKEEVFAALASLSTDEEDCYRRVMERRIVSHLVRYVVLPAEEAAALRALYGEDTLTSAAKAAADGLAEEGGYLGLVAYPDDPGVSDFVQFRLRRSQSFTSFDLREVLSRLAIENGGGHPGAIGFRFHSSEVEDLERFAVDIVSKIEALIGS
ncbi:MAG TPA: DHH family phosphoesterase [Rectinemataceae bacterium]|nr:DHH family phosphoesterase [Rectinemataceae bacterium]